MLCVSHIKTQGAGLREVLIIKIPNSEQSEKARQSQCVFLPRPFPSNLKKKKKEVRKNHRFSPEPSWSLESCQASWQEIRRVCGGNLPVFHRKFIQTETLLRNILLTTNQHSLTKTCAVGNLPASVSYGIIIP